MCRSEIRVFNRPFLPLSPFASSFPFHLPPHSCRSDKMATRRAKATVLIGLAQAAIDNESVTPTYDRGAVEGFVNVLDGWTVPVGIALSSIKYHDPTMRAILDQAYDGLDFVSYSCLLNAIDFSHASFHPDCRVCGHLEEGS